MEAVITYIAGTREKTEQSAEPFRVDYTTLFWLFMFGSVAGFVLEGLWRIVTLGHWENHSSTVWGPFCLIYGVGAVTAYLLAGALRKLGVIAQFAAFTASGAAVEFFGSFFQELCFGSVSWDYSEHVLYLGGRVSLKMALMWGALGIIFIRFAFPLLKRVLEKLSGRSSRVLCIVMTVFMAINCTVTSLAITRWRDREEPADSAVIRWIDETYDDEAMEHIFPNMVFADGRSGNESSAAN